MNCRLIGKSPKFEFGLWCVRVTPIQIINIINIINIIKFILNINNIIYK